MVGLPQPYNNTLIIPFDACGTKSQNMHYFAKSQKNLGMNFLLSDIKLVNA
jgi:hypothetical protein